jgi:proteic killer suppression protein
MVFPVIRSFVDAATEDVFNGRNTGQARRKCPLGLWPVARRRLDQLDSAERLDDLRVPPGNRLEALVGDRKGEHRIRINDQYRICFRWQRGDAHNVELTDDH